MQAQDSSMLVLQTYFLKEASKVERTFKPDRFIGNGNLNSCTYCSEMDIGARGSEHVFLRFPCSAKELVLFLLSDSGKCHNDTTNYIICCFFFLSCVYLRSHFPCISIVQRVEILRGLTWGVSSILPSHIQGQNDACR